MFNNWSDLLPTVKKAFGALGKSNPKMVKAYMALGLRFGDAKYYNIALEAAKPMSDVAFDNFDRRPQIGRASCRERV